MLIRRKRGWQLRESAATSEAVFLERRALIKAIAAGPIIAPALGSAIAAAEEDPSTGLYPAKRNQRYTLDRPLSDEKLATSYNNFYEFGSQKSIASDAQALKVRPWTVMEPELPLQMSPFSCGPPDDPELQPSDPTTSGFVIISENSCESTCVCRSCRD